MDTGNGNVGQGAAMQILIAEDNDVNRVLIRKIFEKLNLSYDLVINGYKAFEAFDNKFYDIVFMDIEMPGMDGFEVTKKLREKFKNQHQKPFIVALTANSLSGERQRCIDLGMNDYLSKPFSAADVQRMVDKAGEYKIR